MTEKLKAYPQYKAAGIEWLSEIPSHWDSMPLKYTVKNQETDFIDGDWIESPFITDTGVRYLTSGNVGPGFYKEQGNGFISDETFDELHCIEVLPGDLLISRLNEPIARTCEVPDLGYKIVTCVDNVIYRPISDIFSRRFMMYQLNSEPFWFNASGLSSGATMKRISRSKLGNIKVIAPSLKEQELIAAYLDDVIGKVDALIAEKQKQVENLRAYRTSLITETVTRGLNPDAPLRPSGIDWFGEIPEHYEMSALKYLTSKIGSGVTPKGGSEVYLDEGILFIRSQNVYPDGLHLDDPKYISESIDESMSNTRVYPGDILLNITGASIGRCCVYTMTERANVNQHVCIIRPLCYLIETQYLCYILNSKIGQDQIALYQTGGNREGLNFEQLKNFAIPLPPLSEQQAIAGFLDEKTEKIDALIDELSKQLDELAKYKKAVISETVTGKVDVRDWTPKN